MTRYLLVAALVVLTVPSMGETTNTLRLKKLKSNYAELQKKKAEADAQSAELLKELLKLEGAITAFQVVVNDETTTSPK